MLDTDELSKEPSTTIEDERSVTVLPVVGVGVCAASLRSLEALFAGIGPALKAAYLIAVRQKEGLDVATVIDVLRRRSPLPVSIAEHGEPIEPNHIYVGGPDDMIGIEDGHLSVRQAMEPVGHRGTIDSMLISLAEHAHDRSVSVLLAGLGSDGTAGVTATKKYGGLSIAEAVPQADDNGAQGVAGPMGVVDLHLPIDQIAAEISGYLKNLAAPDEVPGQDATSDEIEAQVGQITTILRKVVSHDFHGYKRGTFLRRVHRRMKVLQIDTLPAYVERLRDDRQEVQDLFQDLLIGVTQFFRDPQEFEVLERELPRLFEGKGPDDQFRVWVLGCATGEEAYSIAILLREHMATLDQPPRVQIFATDLDARALGLARAGRYASPIESHVRPDRLARWFVREGDTYCVAKELREMCIFSPHNVIKDAPFSRVEILSCRNLLIYLNADLQSRVIPIFHFSLTSGGVLFLGNSENVSRHQKLFTPVDRKNRVFRRLETATRVIPDFPLSPRVRVAEHLPTLPPAAPPPLRLLGSLGRQAEAIAERYAPAYIVVDTQGDVLHFSGRTGRYLEPIAGVASLNVVNLVHRDLRIDLRSALHRAISEARRIELPRLALQQDDRVTSVNMIVEPLGPGDVTSLMILFQDAGPVPDGVGGDRLDDGEHVQRLEAELRLTRDRLQATIEELESTNEELKSSNEEYQSINEELQSANEEMETSKEELQSVNEELQTVNGELGHRLAELGRSNSDLKNLLEATQIATLFLDNDLRVRSFTPSASEIFHLLDTDVGRPLGHVVSRVVYPELQDDVHRVLKTLVPVERTVVDPQNQRHFAAKVLPYRSTDNYISGAVLTFTDLTAVHQAETALRSSETRLQALLSASSQIIYRMSPDWSEMIDLSGKGFLADTHGSSGWMDQHIPEDERPRVRAAIDRARRNKDGFNLEHRVHRLDGTIGWVMSAAVPITDKDGEILEWFGAASDITGRREAEEALRASEERLRAVLESMAEGFALLGSDFTILEVNEETLRLDGRPREQLVGQSQWQAFPGTEHSAFGETLKRVAGGEAAASLEHLYSWPDGRNLWLEMRAYPTPDGGVAIFWRDITDRKRAEEALRDSEEKYRTLFESMDQAYTVVEVLKDAEGKWADFRFLDANPAFLEHTSMPYPVGKTATELLGAPNPRWAQLYGEALDTDAPLRVEESEAELGRTFDLNIFSLDREHHIVAVLFSNITDRREMEERQKVLVAELQHRTRNLIGVVRQMAQKTARTSGDMDDFRERFRERLDALARVQGLLSRLNEHDRVTFDELVHTELAAHGAKPDQDNRVSTEGPEGVRLRSTTVQTLAMALHELATNAVKYGALGQAEARLAIKWHTVLDGADEQPWLHLDWQESGVVMPLKGATAQGSGQGRELIERALPYQLGAKTTYTLEPDGVRCTIVMPVSASNAPGSSDDG